MKVKQETLQDIINTERDLFLQAPNKYGEFFDFALESFVLLENFIKSINPEAFIFAAFLSQIRKHHTLALLSSIRLHHIQAMMNLRQVLEAGSCAAYAIANLDTKDFAENKKGIINPTQELTKKRYKWLENKYPGKSKEVKRLKEIINSSGTHSNIIYAHKNYKFDTENKKFLTPFFDFEDELHVKGDLWLVGNIAMGLIDFLYIVNLDYKKIVFSDSFIQNIKRLQFINDKLKTEVLSNSRFTKFTNQI